MLSETSYRNQPRRRFSREFKRDVVELLQEEAATVAEIAREYDLHPNQLMRWRTVSVRASRLERAFKVRQYALLHDYLRGAIHP